MGIIHTRWGTAVASGGKRVKYSVDVYVSLEHFFLNTFIYFFKFQYN